MDLTRARLRLYFGDLSFGPGKADLLDAIREEGSISAAARRMGMSYKRAWTLVEEMNTSFDPPLIVSARGGAHGGGAQLTPEGEQILSAYRMVVERMLRDSGAEIDIIGQQIKP